MELGIADRVAVITAASRGLGRATAEALADERVRLDIVVANNAGPPPGGAFDVTDQQILDTVQANMLSAVRLVRAARPHLVEQGWGRVCLIASGSARQPMDNLVGVGENGGQRAHRVRRDAQPGLSRRARHRANRRTRQATRARIGDPGDFGRIVAFLCSAHTSYLTGTAIVVDGGRIKGL
jgi:3-oxoacyl-[acyl-carrier protein] reductase